MRVQIEPGDVVRLKSGGPRMTVQVRDPAGGLRCAWFDVTGTGDPSFATFPQDALELSPPFAAVADTE